MLYYKVRRFQRMKRVEARYDGKVTKASLRYAPRVIGMRAKTSLGSDGSDSGELLEAVIYFAL